MFNPRTRAMLAALGVYQEGIAKNMVGDKPVVSPSGGEGGGLGLSGLCGLASSCVRVHDAA